MRAFSGLELNSTVHRHSWTDVAYPWPRDTGFNTWFWSWYRLCNQTDREVPRFSEKKRWGCHRTHLSSVQGFQVHGQRKTGALQTFAEMVTWTLKSEDCEWGFSLMNSIKTNSRNRLQTMHSDQLMKVRSAQAEGPINLDKVYNHWKEDKDRRERL